MFVALDPQAVRDELILPDESLACPLRGGPNDENAESPAPQGLAINGLPGMVSFMAQLMLPSIYWSPDPDLLRVGPLRVRWYGLFFAMAFLLGYQLMLRIYRREGRPRRDLEVLLGYLLVGTIVGARLGHCLFYDPAYYLSHPLAIVRIWEGGLASHGGAIGIFIAVYLYARRHPDQPYLWLLDRLAIPTALGGCLIRIGNFFNSEILGVPSEQPWAVVFARVSPLPRHPAQLYESAAYLVIFGVLYLLYRSKGASAPHGLLLGLFLLLVFSARFSIEFLKMPQAAFAGGLPLQMGQLLSLPAVLAGVLLLGRVVWRRRVHGEDPDRAR